MTARFHASAAMMWLLDEENIEPRGLAALRDLCSDQDAKVRYYAVTTLLDDLRVGVIDRLDALDRRFHLDRGRWTYDAPVPTSLRWGSALFAPGLILNIDAFWLTAVSRIVVRLIAVVLVVIGAGCLHAWVQWERRHRHLTPGR